MENVKESRFRASQNLFSTAWRFCEVLWSSLWVPYEVRVWLHNAAKL